MDESTPLTKKALIIFFTNNSKNLLTRPFYFIRFRIVEWFWKNNPQNWPKPSDYFYKVKATVSQLLLERNFKKSSMELSFFLKNIHTNKDFFLFFLSIFMCDWITFIIILNPSFFIYKTIYIFCHSVFLT